MDEATFSFDAADGVSVSVFRWTNVAPPKAIVQIAHGMGEHAARYRRLAEALTAAGYVVYANDHRGHGTTAGSPDGFGDLGPSGWAGLVSDLGELGVIARREHPGIPLVVLGHSMGSFALQGYLLDHSADIDGAALSGTTALDVIAPGIDPTKEVDLSAFNAPFEPARTEYDWLSRDPDEVDAYVADPACGFGLNPAATASMLDALADTGDAARLAGIRERPADLSAVGGCRSARRRRRADRAGRRSLPPRRGEGRDRRARTPERATRCSTRRTATRSRPTSSPGSTASPPYDT